MRCVRVSHQSTTPRASPSCFHTHPKRLSCQLHQLLALRLVTIGKTFCCERAVVFKEEVSIHIIEEPGVSARVTLAVATDRGDQVFVPVAAGCSGSIEGPSYVRGDSSIPDRHKALKLRELCGCNRYELGFMQNDSLASAN